MGSSQSQPSRPPRPSPPSERPADGASRPPLSARSSTLRRLSQYARGESSGAKRNIAPSLSSSTSRLDSKKPRLEEDTHDGASDTTMRSPESLHSAVLPTPTPLPVPSSAGLPTSPGPPIGATSMQPPMPLSPRGDPLRVERARSIASIRSVLGDDWIPPTDAVASTSAMPPPSRADSMPVRPGTPNRARRSSLPSPNTRGGGGEMAAYLGVSTPSADSDHPTRPAAVSTSTPPSASADLVEGLDVDAIAASGSRDEIRSAIATLTEAHAANTRQLEQRRARIAELEGQIAEATERLEEQLRRQAEAEQALQNAQRDLDEAQRDHDVAEARVQEARAAVGASNANGGSIPTGAMLVIQGLAQTRGVRDGDSDRVSTTERPRHRRRRSDGNLARDGERDEGPTLEAQARMIGGLLTVAAAATATTLLSPTPRPAPRSQSIAASVVDFVMNRLRPNRPFNRAVSNIESALGNYLRGAGRNGEVDLPEGSTTEAPPASTDSAVPERSDSGVVAPPRADFQRFLEVMQVDLVAAVREFASPQDTPESNEPPTTPMATTPPPTEPTSPQEGAVPTFHRQLGQIQRATPSASGITGGADGQARRLNFFRAHVFPPRSPAAGQEDPNAVVPCVFIGVRSIAHDPSLTTDDLVRHPNFPFADGQVPASAGTSPDDASSISSAAPPPAPAAPDRRSFRERVFDRLSLRRSPSRTPNSPLNTYLVYVIGGYYPRNHPVLRIPNLITGGPLTDEEMNLIAELMGPGKPPTATAEEIEKSGLKIVKGGDMKRLGENGEVLESCVERCLICLSDFEDEEECRILACKHGFHKECVDHWLSEGRNNCPACRTEAVAKMPNSETAAVPTPAQATEASDNTNPTTAI